MSTEYESEIVSFALLPQRMVFRIVEWRGGVILMGESPSVVDPGDAGFSIRLTAAGAMRIGRELYRKGKAIADDIDRAAVATETPAIREPADRPGPPSRR